MNFINSLDSSDMTTKEVRHAIYGVALRGRPKSLEEEGIGQETAYLLRLLRARTYR